MGGGFVKTDIGHGRGWLAPAPAASIERIDRQLGRPADINEAGRSAERANENRRKWLAYERYLNGGPWAPKAPYALGADESVHCWGYAADSDDWYDAHAASVWRDNGWRQTARYPGNKAKDEPWHGEYSESRDNHRHDPAPTGGANSAPPVPEEDEDMILIRWNSNHVFGIGREAVCHVPEPATLAHLEKVHGKAKDVDNDGLTAELNFAGVHWDAVDAVLRGAGPLAGGKYWSRLAAEGIAIRGAQAAQSKTLADVLETAKSIGV